MPLVLKDRVKETTSSSGTGSVTLAGPVQGYQGFSSVGEGNTTYYCIAGVAEWEVGIGTYSAGVLSRDTVLGSSANGDKVAFSAGVKDVFCTLPSSKAVVSDSLPITGAINSTSPNATTNVVSITPNVSGTNTDLALLPKGNGALLAEVPDGAVANGNKRGQFAVDWQRLRLVATEVASGFYSVIAGGYTNTASAFYSTVGGGQGNTASGTSSVIAGGQEHQATQIGSTVAGGRQNTASGQYSSVGGGRQNTASANFTTISGGYLNVVSAGASAVLGGQQNSVSGSYSVAAGGLTNSVTGGLSFLGCGQSNTVSGGFAVLGGGNTNTASGDNSVVSGGSFNTASANKATVSGGSDNVADALGATVIGGTYGTTRGVVGYVAIPACNNPIAASVGVSQTGLLILAKETTTGASTRLVSNASATSATNQLVLANNSAVYFRGTVIANVTGGGNTKSWTFDGQIKRGANAASTTLTGSTISSPYGDAGASSWSVSLSADTTNGCLAVTVTGQISTQIRWVCRIESTEVTY